MSAARNRDARRQGRRKAKARLTPRQARGQGHARDVKQTDPERTEATAKHFATMENRVGHVRTLSTGRVVRTNRAFPTLGGRVWSRQNTRPNTLV